MHLSNLFNFIMWSLVLLSMGFYIKLVLTPPGFLEASVINIDKLQSNHQHSSPRVTNFSQKMSENAEERNTSPIRPMKGGKSKKKYIELDESEGNEYNKSSGRSSTKKIASKKVNPNSSKVYRRKSVFEGKEGSPKLIKREDMKKLRSRNSKDEERKRVYDKINDRIAHS